MKQFRLKYKSFPTTEPGNADLRYAYYKRLARKEDGDWFVLTAENGPAYVMDDAGLAIYRREALRNGEAYQVFPLRSPLQRIFRWLNGRLRS